MVELPHRLGPCIPTSCRVGRRGGSESPSACSPFDPGHRGGRADGRPRRLRRKLDPQSPAVPPSEYGTAYVIITHALNVVGYLADRIAVMYLGRIVERRSGRRDLRPPPAPLSRALIAAIPEMDVQRSNTATLVSGEIPEPEEPALRMPLPSALPVRDRAVPGGGAGARRGPAGAVGGVPPLARRGLARIRRRRGGAVGRFHAGCLTDKTGGAPYMTPTRSSR